jgi:hypothetical protein
MATQQKVLNQAEIDAANRKIAEAQRALNAAEAAKTAFGEANKERIISGITGLSTSIKDFTKGLQSGLSGKALKPLTTATKTALGQSKQITGELNPQLKTLEGNISSAAAALAALSVPAPIYDTARSTNLEVLKAILRGMGFNSSIIDSSSTFLLDLLKDGLDYDNAVAIFLNSKEYTTAEGKKLESPFYKEYGYLNEGLVRPKSAAELYNAVEGYKEVRATFNLSEKFISKEYLQGYIKNNVSVAAFSKNANLARLKAVNADSAYTNSLKRLGFITDETDLTDFFLDPKVGEETLNQRKATAALGAEAIKRASQGIQFSTTRFNQIAAGMMALGLSPEEAEVRAAQGMGNIADVLLPTTKLTQIYDRASMQDEALRSQVQSELEAEEYMGLSSERRKRNKELEIRAYQAQAGIYRGGALSKSPTAGAI